MTGDNRFQTGEEAFLRMTQLTNIVKIENANLVHRLVEKERCYCLSPEWSVEARSESNVRKRRQIRVQNLTK